MWSIEYVRDPPFFFDEVVHKRLVLPIRVSRHAENAFSCAGPDLRNHRQVFWVTVCRCVRVNTPRWPILKLKSPS